MSPSSPLSCFSHLALLPQTRTLTRLVSASRPLTAELSPQKRVSHIGNPPVATYRCIPRACLKPGPRLPYSRHRPLSLLRATPLMLVPAHLASTPSLSASHQLVQLLCLRPPCCPRIRATVHTCAADLRRPLRLRACVSRVPPDLGPLFTARPPVSRATQHWASPCCGPCPRACPAAPARTSVAGVCVLYLPVDSRMPGHDP
ncbi:hypothetical protein DFH07DRAFT_80386 [Mycena maculata]|uniref:Uncharacterized protein n=1 Tax=Mycena maculata TaxID=230809 RepID=A0AAD7N0P1_9AGAR|nr:hypothetical protein DFH07DRAFT_80386 [Mycena maculata]